MTIATQIFYLVALVMVFGMAFSAYKGVASSIRSEASVYFWFFALLAQMVSFASFYLYPYVGAWSLVVGNASQLAVDLLLALLFRSMRNAVPRQYILPLGWVLVVYAVLVAELPYVYQVLCVCVASMVVACWQLYELVQLQQRQRSIFIVFLVAAISALVGLSLLRAMLVLPSSDDVLYQLLQKAAYDSSPLELQARMLMVFMYVLVFMGIGNLFFEKTWRISEEMVHIREDQMLMTLQSLAASRDNETGEHLLRTQAYVKLLCQALRDTGRYQDALTAQRVDQMIKVTPLHDIGKVGIPDEILFKQGPHTDSEREIMKSHASLGERILLLSSHGAGDELIHTAAAMAGGHHEHWDGSGYPKGLAGEAIPLAARIMAVADVYDALTTIRVYKQPWSHEDAVAEIVDYNGRYFDPAVVNAFLKVQEDFRAISKQMQG